AEVAETAIGFTSFRLHDDGTGEICGLYVDPAAQGTGHGRTLLLEAEAALFAERARGLVVSSSLSGRPFYTHLGYVDDDAAEYRTRGGLVVEVRRMRKSRLAAALRLEPGEPFAHGHDGLIGTVVVNLESGRAAPGWGSEGWGDGGLMVETGDAGTVHYPLETLQSFEDEAGAEGALRG
ncbi:MAG: GNAT family N-acetyltransferase, partial [Pseudomonadota bacterium]